jgi:hypothetical protein
MLEFLKPIVDTYPGWTLFCLTCLGGSAIAAVPATMKALRGTPSRKGD